jgi:hypothetical protein
MKIRLLVDIRDVFKDYPDRITSADLCAGLAAIEGSPWSEDERTRKPITPSGVARLLKPFGISPRTINLGPDSAKHSLKGYHRSDFADAWERYLPPLSQEVSLAVTPSPSGPDAVLPDSLGVTTPSHDVYEVPPRKASPAPLVTATTIENINTDAVGDVLTARTPTAVEAAKPCAYFKGMDLRKPCAACGGRYASHSFGWPKPTPAVEEVECL